MRWFLLSALSSISAAHACLWDQDTIASEKARFPEIPALISGEFPRHSREFYEWRKGRSEARIAADPSDLAAYDDLAVAQHKLGDHRAAIATMERKEAVKPGIYETYSNLGTFLIYTGDLDGALRQIDKALATNPDAHFGREKYQKWLVEWLKEGREGVRREYTEDASIPPFGFAAFILSRQSKKPSQYDDSIRLPALAGVTGMMRFADFDNPILQEALGDLLACGPPRANATLHASMAYLNAAARTAGAGDKAMVMQKYELAVSVTDIRGAAVQKQLATNLEKGKKLAEAVRADEIAWIAAGKDASAEFSKKYLKP